MHGQKEIMTDFMNNLQEEIFTRVENAIGGHFKEEQYQYFRVLKHEDFTEYMDNHVGCRKSKQHGRLHRQYRYAESVQQG